jgi:hypothetical protein
MSTDEGHLHESDGHQYVTIPYFLYEAMARAYYQQDRNADLPVPDESKDQTNLNLSDIYFNSSDIPPTWKPGGIAARKHRHGLPEVQSPEEEA